MLLTGTHDRTVDEKNRLVLPKRFREQMGNTVYVAPGQDNCLWIYAENELNQLADKLDQAPSTDEQVRIFRRLFFSQAEAVDLDRSGRLLLPERLRQSVGIEKDVVLIGVRDHLELWDQERWNQFFQQHASRFDSVAEQAFRK